MQNIWQGETGFRDRAALAFAAVALVPGCVVAIVLWGASPGPLLAERTALAARNFTALWAAGRLAAAPALDVLADPERFTGALRAWFGAGFPAQIWPYPPTALLLAAPFATLALLPGFLLYTVLGPLVLAAALYAGGFGARRCAAVLFSPAVLDNALCGQNGALTGALLLGGLLLLDERPLLAGALLGALVIKPQLGLLLPVCLVAGRRWRALAAAAATGAALAGLSAALFGMAAWSGFLLHTRPLIAAYLERPWQGLPSQGIFASAFMAARALGAGLAVAYAVQGAVTLAAAGLAWSAWRRSTGRQNTGRRNTGRRNTGRRNTGDPSGRVALTVALSLAASPWVHGYDMPPLAAAVILLLPRVAAVFRPLLAWAWFWPGALVLLPIPLPLCVLSLGSVAWLGWRRLTLSGPAAPA